MYEHIKKLIRDNHKAYGFEEKQPNLIDVQNQFEELVLPKFIHDNYDLLKNGDTFKKGTKLQYRTGP